MEATDGSEFYVLIGRIRGRRRWYGARRPDVWIYRIFRNGKLIVRGLPHPTERDAMTSADRTITSIQNGTYYG